MLYTVVWVYMRLCVCMHAYIYVCTVLPQIKAHPKDLSSGYAM